ncbi:hypothetical protein AUJ84_01725 [Candidatus Pacearchaeota archaeon CG1_02_32_132]|nr:MAG: hypothetical protein AUJ84_01725 [Candidatus Pacearchaeota archaeon CG1_02_32_132]
MGNVGEEKTSFGEIVAVIGAVLIAVGVAWIIFKNWNSIHDILKVLILLLAIGVSYGVGVLLRIQDYEKIGNSLIVLGGLLYILSIFLIAQIFDLSTSFQVNSMLLLLAWIGVFVSAYIFNSSGNLVVAMATFLFWAGFQHFALLESGIFSGFDDGIGSFLLVLLVVGILFYGLSLWHHSRDNKFAGVYRWWTGFYFLAFAYIMSFQMFLPGIWPNGLIIASKSFVFIAILLVLAFLFLIVGMITALNRKKLELKSVFVFAGGLLLMLILIISASAISGTLGRCDEKSCYDFNSQSSCNSIDFPDKVCQWKAENRTVYSFEEGTGTNSMEKISYCTESSCFDFKDVTACATASSKMKCSWNIERSRCENPRRDFPGYDRTIESCGQYDNNRDSCLSQNYCGWTVSRGGVGRDAPLGLWLLWIFANIMLLLVILAVIGYGVWRHSPRLVNLGISFFVLGIITRYIGFIMDYWDYGGLSLLFIVGGIILIVGGWLIERWRRNLVKKAEKQEKKFQDYW